MNRRSETDREKVLSLKNVDSETRAFRQLISNVGASIRGKQGIDFLKALKREPISVGPYSSITLYEASNRIMTDLVILCGVRWLLKRKHLPYASYRVDFGNENTQQFDVMAEHKDGKFSAEAFNVAPSYFSQKFGKEIEKLRNGANGSRCRAILVNHDAIAAEEVPHLQEGEVVLLVDVRRGAVKAVPNNALQRMFDPSRMVMPQHAPRLKRR
jgi:hypothetical protein